MDCVRCDQKAHYKVLAPLCFNSVPVYFCPACFQSGIDAGAIAWLGDEAYGICADHEEHAA